MAESNKMKEIPVNKLMVQMLMVAVGIGTGVGTNYLYQSIVGEVYTIISEGKFTQLGEEFNIAIWSYVR